VESHYWWQGKIESGSEVLMILKTTRARLARLQKFILNKHPYGVSEFLVLPLKSGSKAYLDWLSASVARQ
jgi:periplasmic divalent cation tolerance protein